MLRYSQAWLVVLVAAFGLTSCGGSPDEPLLSQAEREESGDITWSAVARQTGPGGPVYIQWQAITGASLIESWRLDRDGETVYSGKATSYTDQPRLGERTYEVFACVEGDIDCDLDGGVPFSVTVNVVGAGDRVVIP